MPAELRNSVPEELDIVILGDYIVNWRLQLYTLGNLHLI